MDGPKYKLLFCEFAQLYPKRSNNSDYRARSIISLGLYIFYPIFQCGNQERLILQTIYALNKEILQ